MVSYRQISRHIDNHATRLSPSTRKRWWSRCTRRASLGLCVCRGTPLRLPLRDVRCCPPAPPFAVSYLFCCPLRWTVSPLPPSTSSLPVFLLLCPLCPLLHTCTHPDTPAHLPSSCCWPPLSFIPPRSPSLMCAAVLKASDIASLHPSSTRHRQARHPHHTQPTTPCASTTASVSA